MMLKWGKGRKKHERILREMYDARARMENDGSSPNEKSKLSKQMNATRAMIAREAIQFAGEQLRTEITGGKNDGITPGLRVRRKMDTNKDSARMILPDLLGKEGVRAIHQEVQTAYNYMLDKKRLKMQIILASGGSTTYCYLFFKNDPNDSTEEPKMFADMSQARSKFPTVGFYSGKHFYPLPMYTLYLQEIAWKGVALAVPGQPLPYMRANYLSSYANSKREDYNNGSLHGDFDVTRQHLWDTKGHPATSILCIHGETSLRFSTVSRGKEDGNHKQKKDTHVTLNPGDSVWFGWRQYHATHVSDELEYIPPNQRLQCMLSSLPEDVAGTKEEEVTLHSNPDNKQLHDMTCDEILGPKKKKKK